MPTISRGQALYAGRLTTYATPVLGGYIPRATLLASRPITYNRTAPQADDSTVLAALQTAPAMILDLLKSSDAKLDETPDDAPVKAATKAKRTKKKLPANNYPLVGLIASKNPVAALEVTVQSLFQGGCESVYVVDDGSDDPESLAVFDRAEAAGATVIHLERNMGKSKALKRAFKSIPAKSIIVQTDDDTLAGDLSGPAKMIRENKADIVDIRVETIRTNSVIGIIQELDYWLINAVTKRVQDILRARLWMSGASVMYSHAAGKELLLKPAHSMTEDTEGLFRARSKGFRVRYYAKHDAQFLTMVPEDFVGLHKQWKRWSTGNGQVMRMYGLGAGDFRIAAINAVSWFNLLLLPVLVVAHFGLISTGLWEYGWGILMGILGAIRLKRPRLALVGMFIPYISILWAIYGFYGLVLSSLMARSGKETSLTWVSPKRTAVAVELPTA
jgi:cellulose synthase/poly-beta-1,6-N-acetylglucosamine synthase-like glycosyltransferase